MGRRRTVAWVAGVSLPLVVLAGALAGVVEEPMIAPADGAFRLEGRGFGHGRGMSQWGAQGAAVHGIGYRQILATYYPGTEPAREDPDRRVKVLITTDRDGDLQVVPAPGLLAVRGEAAVRLPERLADQPVTRWRVRLERGRLQVAGKAGRWRHLRVGDPADAGEPVRFRPAKGRQVRLVLPTQHRDYRGELRAYRNPATGQLAVVNRLRLESYLRSVVPSEAFSSWRPDALRAQAVAARTYARWRTANVRLAGGVADICDTTACQAYRGVRSLTPAGRITRVWEAASTDAAIRSTAGEVLRYGGAPALTEFSASNGGWSTAGDKPYLVARPDPWDGLVAGRAHAWTVDLRATRIAKAFPDLGRIRGLVVRRRDGNGLWGGRVLSLRIVGTSGSAVMSGATFAHAVGLRHYWWQAVGPVVTPSPSPVPTVTEAPALPKFPPWRPR
jgi:SpoIID/LytB domain protein